MNESNNKGPTGFSALKYVQPTDVTPGYSTVSDADIVVLRYAHVLLMIAEAENEAHGATTTALNAINEVRTRSGQPVSKPVSHKTIFVNVSGTNGVLKLVLKGCVTSS